MKHTDTVIIGGGQAGLAVSRCLIERNIDNVVLERGRIGERWRSERWDSLRLLSPNWMARLPHYRYQGDDPDGFMTMPEFIRYLDGYAESFEAPVHTGTSVELVERLDTSRFIVRTNHGSWNASNVVIATGFCDVPRVPSFASGVSDEIVQITPPKYRRPNQLPAGNVVVVGASSTGLQIADELLRAGRSVTVSVGTHVRLPRRYRGRDILHWMVAMGAFTAEANPTDERLSPPPQLVGTPDNRDLDLAVLLDHGARLVGRTLSAAGNWLEFGDDLAECVSRADDGMVQLLAKIDEYIAANVNDDVPVAEPIRRVTIGLAPREIDLKAEGISSIVWATGYERSYPWLKVPVVDERGEICHFRGITPVPGVYVVGMRFQSSKGSNLIDGVGADAEAIAAHLATRTDDRRAA